MSRYKRLQAKKKADRRRQEKGTLNTNTVFLVMLVLSIPVIFGLMVYLSN